MTKRFQILVCDGPSCGMTLGSAELKEKIEARLGSDPALAGSKACDLTCFGRCDDGPNMLVRELPDDDEGDFEPDYDEISGVKGLYTGMNAERVERMMDEHVAKDAPIEDWVEVYD